MSKCLIKFSLKIRLICYDNLSQEGEQMITNLIEYEVLLRVL